MGRAVEPVLVLGAGINGAAVARELALNRLPVCLVDTADIASGATAASSRLIHGGLRYLEYGEFDLVRESLAERGRLLRLAPQFVRPLRLFIPVRSRWGGVVDSARRLLGLPPRTARPRGLWLVRAGLALYDLYAKDPLLPRHRLHVSGDPEALPLDAARFPWQLSFSDAQVLYPERLVLAFLHDARHLAERAGVELQVFTYHRAELSGDEVRVVRVADGRAVAAFRPSALINATGSWVDWTLGELKIASRKLMGGTKGSHFLSTHAPLRELLAGRGVYAEAPDARPFFILPLGAHVLVGTTDLPFDRDPREAVATPEELDYLLAAVTGVFPQAGLRAEHIDWHYSGVRPLPASGGTLPAAITRRHWLEEHPGTAIPAWSIIGGKLTTCRSLAEQVALAVTQRLSLEQIANSRTRPVPGAEGWPSGREAPAAEPSRPGRELEFSREQLSAARSLCGTRAAVILAACGADEMARENVPGTWLPRGFVRWVIEHEWVSRLDDLVERRLMLLYQPRLTRQSLRALAMLLAACGKLPPEQVDEEVARTGQRLLARYGKRLEE